MKTTTLPSKNWMNRPLLGAFVLIAIALACFILAPQAQAVCQDACLSNNNTVQGDDALIGLTAGTDNTALGFNALLSDTTGSFNVAAGSQALANNTIGGGNVAIGYQALFSSQTVSDNIAVGDGALYSNTSGYGNIAIGALALNSNTTASANVAVGDLAARLNSTGIGNTAVGSSALYANQGGSNSAFGAGALGANTTSSGSNNTAVGTDALFLNSGSNNTAIGASAGDSIQAGNDNIFIGFTAGAMVEGGNHNIEIAHHGTPGDISTIRIGTKKNQKNTYIAGITGVTVAGGVGVIVDASGHLGTVTSSARFKDNVRLMDKTSEAILALQPVTFRYKHDLDPDGIPQFGLVAEDVEKVNPDLVARDEQGKPYTVRYEAVNAMLLNEFLKEHHKVQQLEKQVAALTAGLQKVSAQLEVRKSDRQTVLNQ